MLHTTLLLLTAVAQDVTALVGADLIDGTGAEPVIDAVVLVQDGRIRCTGRKDQCPVPDSARVVQLEGRWITPGLVDAHVHYSQTGWADGRPDSLDVRARFPYPQVIADLEAHPGRWHRSYLCSGVTAVFDVGGYAWTWDIREHAQANPRAPHYVAAGPLLSTLDHWLNLPAARQFIYLGDESNVLQGVEYLAAFDTDAVKVWLINTGQRDFGELKQLAQAAGRAASELGLPLIVHATGLAEARAAVAAGADLLVHSVDDQPVDRAFVDAMLAGDVIYTPTLTVHRGYFEMYRAALQGEEPDVDDPNHCVDPATLQKLALTAELGHLVEDRDPAWLAAFEKRLEQNEATMARNLKTLYEAGVTIAAGTDAGNPFTLHGPAIYPELEAMQAAGMPPGAVIVSATRNAARAMGRLAEFGTLETGKSADLLVLGANPAADVANFRALEYVMRAGVLSAQSGLQAE